ncbi:IS630 family transposase [Mesorhizobium sp. M0684]|uniref:IS630 family transposase n=1 Tax=Mesorhizobium sp. M0684 TaxID=2956986 RepID=UPI003336B743
MSARQAAARLGVGVSSAIRWIARAKIGELAPRPQGRRRASSLDAHEAFIGGLIEERKDITLNEMVERLLAEHSVRISRSALSAWLRGRGWTFKKVRTCTGAGSPRHPEAATGLVRRPARSRPCEARVHRRDGIVDEDGAPAWKSATRRALPGRRAAWPLETTTFTGALRLTGMTAPFVYDGAMNGNVFLAYVEQVLVPTLSKDDIVVMDNLPAHKAGGVRDAIEAAGASLLYLPPTVPTSIRSRTPSPSSRRCCEQRPKEPSPHCGTRSVRSSTSSPQPNAQTTSKRPDMAQIKQDVL